MAGILAEVTDGGTVPSITTTPLVTESAGSTLSNLAGIGEGACYLQI